MTANIVTPAAVLTALSRAVKKLSAGYLAWTALFLANLPTRQLVFRHGWNTGFINKTLIDYDLLLLQEEKL